MAFPVELRFIIETEKKLGAKFPLDYVRKMVIENGGEVCVPPDVWMLYPIFDSSDKKRLKRTCNDVVRETQYAARESPGFPDDAVAIGNNGGGDQLVLLRDKHAMEILAEEVYWWDHETSELNLVASTFGDLLKG